MPVFSSSRERRLWIIGAVVVLAIYSTLGLAQTLAGTLREDGLLEITFGFGLLLIVMAIAIQSWRQRRGMAEIGILVSVAAVYLMLFVRMATPEERTHVIEYSIVALLILEALTERRSQGRTVPAPYLLAILVTSAVGLFDELIQLFLPSRIFDPLDILFNCLAAVLAVTATAALRWARRRVIKRGHTDLS